MKLDLSSLRKAVESLERAVSVADNNDFISGLSDDAKDAIRAGVIQNFEVAYEFCWKYIQRWLRENAPSGQAEFPRSRKELFRLAARSGLIKNPLTWFSYGDARNLSSHTYDERKAESVYLTALDFVKDARSLLETLEELND
jgi:nucleotidyltransferase substrate binding protein (TIGR01987 family)